MLTFLRCVACAGVLCLPFAAVALAPCNPTVTGKLEIFPLNSRVFHNTRNLRVWLPPGYDATKKYPVLYILDGASAFDACTAYDHGEMRADETLTELIAAGKIPPVIAVGVDNGSDAVGQSHSGQGDTGSVRAWEFLPFPDPHYPATQDPLGTAFPSFLETDVMPAVEAKYPVLTGAEHTAIWGASYGGVAALYALLHRPDLFGSGIVESPSVQTGNGQLLRDTMYLETTPARIAVGIGTAEFPPGSVPNVPAKNASIVRQVEQLVQNLKSAYDPGQVQLTITPGGAHNSPTFGKRFAAGLLFLYGQPPEK